ncbi:inositol monophosphatase, partial [Xanthomonas oryzae pv. oryzae]
GRVCDYKGATPPRMDNMGPQTQQIVAGNIKISDALQKVIVNTGYAREFDATF